MNTTNINLNDLAHEIYLENLNYYKFIWEERFTNYFCKKMEWVTLNTAGIVHAIVFCTKEYKLIINQIQLFDNAVKNNWNKN